MGLSDQQLWNRGRNIFGSFLLLISIPCSLQVKIFLYHTIPTPGQGHSVKKRDFFGYFAKICLYNFLDHFWQYIDGQNMKHFKSAPSADCKQNDNVQSRLKCVI